jgi:hypothetical protein
MKTPLAAARAGGGGGGAPPGTLNEGSLAPVVSSMLTAFAQSIAGNYQAGQLEQHEFTQLLEDIYEYNLEYQQNQLTAAAAQSLISMALDAVPSVIATARALRKDAAVIAMNGAKQVLNQAIQTTLSAAFGAFAFKL